MTVVKPIADLAADLASGTTTARRLVEEALERIEDPAGEGGKAFLSVAAERARATADGVDSIRRGGGSVPRFAGLPFAVTMAGGYGTDITDTVDIHWQTVQRAIRVERTFTW